MCPARLILLPPGSRDRLTGERVAMVYASPAVEEAAARLAEELSAGLTVVPELAEAAVQEIADQHRGETVVLVAPELGIALPAVIEHEGDGWTVQPSPNEVTLATYEEAAEQFRDSIPRGPNAFLIELFDLIDDHLRSGGSVLELGSGTGRDAVELERRGHRVRRTDAAQSFVEMIRANGYEADQLNALTDDLGGPYDLVFADAVFLHFTPDQLAAVLRKAHDAAELIAFTTSEGDGDEWSTRYLDLPRHFTLWQEQPLRDLLAHCGWTVLAWQRGQATRGGWYYVLAHRT
ncbi:class I SAM-dependent methyltransferase [Kribbella catacumbae]|uniref:class I SAM-dependent methyltransferase n=1 Tax=Kribbella catacumbae TaxID=460086 RepID=UPI001ED9B2F0|nr:class I SAM-dependent methyltransferase [Kribbella catacumbae]